MGARFASNTFATTPLLSAALLPLQTTTKLSMSRRAIEACCWSFVTYWWTLKAAASGLPFAANLRTRTSKLSEPVFS